MEHTFATTEPQPIDATVNPFVLTEFASVGDQPFIYSTWVKSYGLSQTARMCRNEKEYMKYQSKLIAAILSRPSTQVYVCRSKDELDSILSYAVIDCVLRCLHYTYTKYNFRNCALSANLCLGKGLEYYSHHRSVNTQAATAQGFKYEHLMPKWAAHLRYQPYLLLEVMSDYGHQQQQQHQHQHQHGNQVDKQTTK